MKRLICFMLAIFCCINLISCGSSDYENAIALMDQGKYEEAILSFEALGDYKDSAEMVKECRYAVALDLFNTGDYNSALLYFQELGEYKDSSDLTAQCEQNLLPINRLLDYLEKDGTYLSAYNSYGIQLNSDNIHTALISDAGKLKFIFEIGSPIVDWKSMDLMAFHNYVHHEMPSKIPAVTIGDYEFNHVKMTITMNPKRQFALCNVEYIEVDTYWGDLNTATATASFNYSEFTGNAEFDGSGFNTIENKQLQKRCTPILATGTELLSILLKECDGAYTLKDIGWARLG